MCDVANGCLASISFVISLLLSIVFFSKKNIKNIETDIFKKMLICNMLEAFLTIVIVYSKSIFFLQWLSRIDVILINIWCSLMFYYIYSITNTYKSSEIKKAILFFNILVIFFSLFLNVTVTIGKNAIDFQGPLIYLGFFAVFMNILFMICTLLFSKNKKENIYLKKYLPFVFLIIMLILVTSLRIIMPYTNFVSIVFSFIDMIMIFTIENPDLKMLNEMTLIKNELEKANNIKSEFISSMSHEMKTPLNAIIGFNEINEYAESLEEVKENNKEIREACNNLLDMVNNTFDMITIEKYHSNIKLEIYDPREEINKVVSLYKERIKSKGLYFTLDMKNASKLIGDKQILKRIVNNILNNAYKFTENGSIRVSVSYKKGELIIKVEDTGIGIKKEELNKIFLPFVKTNDTKNSKYSGLGLGLSITKYLVESINGKITLTSVYQKGTKVILKIKQKESR